MEQLKLGAATVAKGELTLPGSKSISNRILLLAALAEGSIEIVDVLASDDTARMLEALRVLGITIDDHNPKRWRVIGCRGDFPNKNADLFLGNAGTAIRPLTAALALSKGRYCLSGVARMHERPIGDLVDGLRQVGAQIEYTGQAGFPPLQIVPATIQVDTPIKIRGDVSSQFLTALLMALPLTGLKATIEVVGELISKPYIEITLNLMARFGVHVVRDGWQTFTIPAQSKYISPSEIYVEGDASSASYFLAAGAIGGGPLTVHGVGKDSIQGDIKFTEAVEMMGAQVTLNKNSLVVSSGADLTKLKRLKAIDLDCNHMPDAAMTIAVMALFADGPSTLRNIASWRVKETDRLTAMACELRKVGAVVEEGVDFIRITPPEKLIPNAQIDTYDDHRMAMCFSLVSLGGVPIVINDPQCVNKTFPTYFEAYRAMVT